MPFKHGRATELLLDEKDVSTYFNAADLSVDVATADATTFKKNWHVFHPGIADGKLEAGGFYDPTFEDVRQALQVTPDTIISLAPGGITAFGDPVRMLSGVTGSYKESASVGGMAMFSWSVQGTDTLGIGHTFHPLAAETATGFSAYLDGGAATLLGAVAHLHVTAISGTATPTVTVKFRDATSGAGAGLADITGGAFAAATTIQAQRLVIPGTIRQFVRVDWTISGTTPSLTFAVALARRT